MFIRESLLKQVTLCSMHSIVTTFREAVIKVEVANFGAAIDTLIDQDEENRAIILLKNLRLGPFTLTILVTNFLEGLHVGGVMSPCRPL